MSKITPEHLARQAVVYVRQSTPDQVVRNLESQRRQYNLPERARQLGWSDVTVIDDDLGRSGGGVARPGFEKLLAAICEVQSDRVRAQPCRKDHWSRQWLDQVARVQLAQPQRHRSLSRRRAPRARRGNSGRGGRSTLNQPVDRATSDQGRPARGGPALQRGTLDHQGGRS